MSKYVLRIQATGSNVPLDQIVDHLPGDDDDRVWADEYTLERGENDDSDEQLLAHVPFHAEDDARNIHGEIGALNGVMTSADDGYIHVHECPTGGDTEAWSCGDRVLVDIQAGESDGSGGDPTQ